MRRLWPGLFVLGLAVLPGGAADDPKSAADVPFATLKKEFDEAFKKYTDEQRREFMTKQQAAVAERQAAERALKEAKTDEDKKAAEAKLRKPMAAMKAISMADGPGEKYAPLFFAFAVKNPNDPAVMESLALAMRTSGGARGKLLVLGRDGVSMPLAIPTSGGATGKSGLWAKVLDHLRTNYLTKPEIKRILRDLAGAEDESSDQLLRDIMAKSPDRNIQARACKALASGRTSAARTGEFFKTNAAMRKNFEEQLGKEKIEKIVAGADQAQKDADLLNKTLIEKFAEVIADVSPGKPAPELVSQDLQGKAVKLSSLKGKVVVLDIWATWCVPCRAMIPHEREMVGRLEGKPFALVSISVDQEKKTLTDFLDKEKMPWMHWWNGAQGGIIEDWEVQYYPTIYVIDANGVIRHKDLRGEKLEEAVDDLLKEIEGKKSE